MNTCDYLTYVSGALAPCGKPATHQAAKPSSDRTHKCYCGDHNKIVTKPGGISTLPIKRETANQKEERIAAAFGIKPHNSRH